MWDVADLPAPATPNDAAWPDVLDLRVTEVTWEADGVIGIRLRDRDGRDLPPWTPGAHLEVVLPSGLVRHYSLCSDPADRTSYKIAVLREEGGRGGSAEMHDLPLVGRFLKIRGPRNHFALVPDTPLVLIAGGIGITPIVSMLMSLPPGADWQLYYLGRSRGTMAFVDQLVALGGERVHLAPKDEVGRFEVGPVLEDLVPGTSVYCCGPPSLLEAVEHAVSTREDVAVYSERFVPAEARGVPGGENPHDSSFDVELRRSDVVLTVPPDRSVLSVVRDVIPDVPYSCEEGYCGSCETRVLSGQPDHRDDILSEQERAANDTMFICVSRACSRRLVLDL
jgi:ferredoxin-NADP reductase